MNSEIKKLWLRALRSGEYKQGVCALRKITSGGYEFCCLGVLCDLYTKQEKHQGTEHAEWVPKWLIDEQTSNRIPMRFSSEFDGVTVFEEVVPPAQVWKWAGLDKANPSVDFIPKESEPGQTRSTLADLNDGGLGFDLIADIIEKQL
jgi:hypothetical protein